MKRNTNYIWLMIAALTILLSGCNTDKNNNFSSQSANNTKLVSVQLMAGSITAFGATGLTLPKGNTITLNAFARYDDGSSVDITDEVVLHTNSDHVSIASGSQVTGVSQGDLEIWATFQGVYSQSLNMTVSDSELERIIITPSNDEANLGWNYIIAGNSLQLVAKGVYADRTLADITNKVKWRTNEDVGVTITSSGLLVTSADDMPADSMTLLPFVDAVVGDIASNPLPVSIRRAVLTDIKLMSKKVATRDQSDFSLAIGNTFEFIALGIYDDGSKADITNRVISHSYNAGNGVGYLLNVSKKGLVKAKETEGVNRITVSLLGVVSNSLTFTITSPELTAFTVTPHSTSIAAPVRIIKNTEQQFVVTGTYSDGTVADITNRVNWGLDFAENGIVSLSTTGLVRGLITGAAQMHVTLDDDIKASDDIGAITVSIKVIAPTLQSIAIINNDEHEIDELSLAVNERQKLKAIATFDDGSTLDITKDVFWGTSSQHISYIHPYRGWVTAYHVGADTIEVEYGTFRDELFVEVTAAP